MEFSRGIIDIFNKYGFTHTLNEEIDDHYIAEFENWTPGGENWIFGIHFMGDLQQFVKEFSRFVRAFNVDESVKEIIRAGDSGLPYVSELLEDAEWKKRILLDVESEMLTVKKECKAKTKTLYINMAYCWVGDTSIEVPAHMTIEQAYDYAVEHIADIPVADNAEYIPDSDNFELYDCRFEGE